MCVYFVLFKLIFIIIVPLNADLFMLFIMFAFPLYISISPYHVMLVFSFIRKLFYFATINGTCQLLLRIFQILFS